MGKPCRLLSFLRDYFFLIPFSWSVFLFLSFLSLPLLFSISLCSFVYVVVARMSVSHASLGQCSVSTSRRYLYPWLARSTAWSSAECEGFAFLSSSLLYRWGIQVSQEQLPHHTFWKSPFCGVHTSLSLSFSYVEHVEKCLYVLIYRDIDGEWRDDVVDISIYRSICTSLLLFICMDGCVCTCRWLFDFFSPFTLFLYLITDVSALGIHLFSSSLYIYIQIDVCIDGWMRRYCYTCVDTRWLWRDVGWPKRCTECLRL